MNALGAVAYEHVRRLAGEIGPRLIGTPGHHAAAAYIEAQLAAAGLAVERQPMACPAWEEGPASVTLEGVTLAAYANTFSPAATLEAPTLALGTLAELQASDLTGRLVVFYGALAQRELAAQGAIYVSPRDREIIQRLAHPEQRPAGLITVNPSLHAHWRLVEDFDCDLPSVTVTPRVGLALVQRAGALVTLRVAAQRAPGHTDNLIGSRAGARPERLVLCAHYDTKAGTPGAYDNAAGVGVMLAVAGALAAQARTHTLEVIAFTGEEGYGLGDMEYARRLGDGFAQISAALNVDGPGPYLAANTLAVFAASDAFRTLAAETAARYPGVEPVDPWPASDHYIFYSHGVPSLALSSLGVRDQYHTPDDSLEWISPAKLDEAARLALDLLTALDAHGPAWGRPA